MLSVGSFSDNGKVEFIKWRIDMRHFFLTFLLCICALTLHATTFTIATYNIRNANQGDSLAGNGWGQRYPYIAQLIQFHGIFLEHKRGNIPNYRI